jgi:HEAT repeat protein
VNERARDTALKWLVGVLGVVFLGWLSYQMPLVRELLVPLAERCGPSGVPFLCRRLEDSNLKVRQAAAGALKRLGKTALPVLTRALQDPDADIRIAATDALLVLGPEARDALPDLLRACRDSDPRVRAAAVRAAWWTGSSPGDVQAQILRSLEDPDLGHLRPGEDPAPVVPALVRALKDPEARVRQEAADALEHLGPKAREAIPALQEAARTDADPGVRREANEALRGMTHGAKED